MVGSQSARSQSAELAASARSTVGLHYTVAMPQPTSHLFEVTLTIAHWAETTLDLKMPVWTPGSYLVREYARHVQRFSAIDDQGQALPWQKQGKNHWQVQTPNRSSLTIRYQVFANELTVRTNQLDHTHGYFNGAAMFYFIPGCEALPIDVTIVPPPGWKVATSLPAGNAPNHYRAANFDRLVDSPFEIGTHSVYQFEAAGKPHEYVVWGENHNLNVEQLINDTQKIIETEAAMFGELPYDNDFYQFILHLPVNGYGGLEHRNGCCLIFARRGFGDREKYEDFLQLVAHEFFHLWNIKRIRPKALAVFDYEQENYTPSLWFSEGTTSYYDFLIPFRAGLYGAKTYLKNLSKEITRYLTTPGRNVQPLSESSFDAWIKLYRPDANSPNSQMSYYLKGAMVTFLLDMVIRTQHHNQKSFDDVLPIMWQKFGKSEVGFTPDDLRSVIESVAGCDLTNFFDRYVHGLEELPFSAALSAFGLQLVSNADEGKLPPFTGLTLHPGKDTVKFVEAGSPAEMAGINVGDQLVAIEHVRITGDRWLAQLQDYRSGDSIQLQIFHEDILREVTIELAAPRATQYFVVPMAAPTPEQRQMFIGWMGDALECVS
jgi:predicted metalloprotease with PDZ domain